MSLSLICSLALWLCVMLLTLSRFYTPADILQPWSRVIRAVGLASVGVGLISTERDANLWFLLAGLAAMMLLQRWQWKR